MTMPPGAEMSQQIPPADGAAAQSPGAAAPGDLSQPDLGFVPPELTARHRVAGSYSAFAALVAGLSAPAPSAVVRMQREVALDDLPEVLKRYHPALRDVAIGGGASADLWLALWAHPAMADTAECDCGSPESGDRECDCIVALPRQTAFAIQNVVETVRRAKAEQHGRAPHEPPEARASSAGRAALAREGAALAAARIAGAPPPAPAPKPATLESASAAFAASRAAFAAAHPELETADDAADAEFAAAAPAERAAYAADVGPTLWAGKDVDLRADAEWFATARAEWTPEQLAAAEFAPKTYPMGDCGLAAAVADNPPPPVPASCYGAGYASGYGAAEFGQYHGDAPDDDVAALLAAARATALAAVSDDEGDEGDEGDEADPAIDPAPSPSLRAKMGDVAATRAAAEDDFHQHPDDEVLPDDEAPLPPADAFASPIFARKDGDGFVVQFPLVPPHDPADNSSDDFTISSGSEDGGDDSPPFPPPVFVPHDQTAPRSVVDTGDSEEHPGVADMNRRLEAGEPAAPFKLPGFTAEGAARQARQAASARASLLHKAAEDAVDPADLYPEGSGITPAMVREVLASAARAEVAAKEAKDAELAARAEAAARALRVQIPITCSGGTSGPPVGLALPRRATGGAAGYDITALTCGMFRPNDAPLAVPTGVALAIPPGHYVQIFGRSGHAARHGLVVHPGIIDSDYRGELKVLMLATRTALTWDAGERIAQLVVRKSEPADFVPVARLGETARGAGGFGSTGAK
jgi:dUTP pyrophosphatase